MKQLDENFPADIEEILYKIEGVEAHVKLSEESVPDSLNRDHEPLVVSADTQEAALIHEKVQLGSGETSKDKWSKTQKKQDDQVGVQSIEMLKVRTALEEKLKKNGIFSSMDPKLIKANKHLHHVNGQFETYEDLDDETSVHNKGAITNGLPNVGISDKVSRLGISNLNKTKMEKNRGLTWARKKLIKNPRKKYKFKDAENRRKGQVREIKKPMHLYGREARFKSKTHDS